MDEADERINLCKRVMTSEMVEKQGELQDVLFGFFLGYCIILFP
jgi:hypothetical protein